MKPFPTITKATVTLNEEGYRLAMSISDGSSFENLSVSNTAEKLKEYVGEFSVNDMMFAGLNKQMANAIIALR